MGNQARAARDAYRAAIARTVAAAAVLDGAEPGTALYVEATASLARCMAAEIEAGRSFMATLDAMRSDRTYRRRGRPGAARRSDEGTGA